MMKRNHESGVTMIEVLVVVVIGFLITFLLYSILSNGANTYDKQINMNKDLNDAAYALKVITKEIRKSVDVTIIESSCTLNVGDHEFRFEEGVLYHNGAMLVQDLQSFKVTAGDFNEAEQCLNANSGHIAVKLVTSTNQEYAAQLTLRKGK